MWGRSSASSNAPETLSIEQRYNMPYFNQLFEQLNKHRQPTTFKEVRIDFTEAPFEGQRGPNTVKVNGTGRYTCPRKGA
jgi:hypothetical protein